MSLIDFNMPHIAASKFSGGSSIKSSSVLLAPFVCCSCCFRFGPIAVNGMYHTIVLCAPGKAHTVECSQVRKLARFENDSKGVEESNMVQFFNTFLE